jgi:hypothetical protein
VINSLSRDDFIVKLLLLQIVMEDGEIRCTKQHTMDAVDVLHRHELCILF